MKKTYQKPCTILAPLQFQTHLFAGSGDVDVNPKQSGNQEEAEAKPFLWGDIWSDEE